MNNTASWSSRTFIVYPYESQWSSQAGIYIFAGLNQQTNRWISYYIGQCDSFQNRIPSHKQWEKAMSLGATHVHAMVVEQEAQRTVIEAELIQMYQPTLNTQLR